MLSKVSSPTKLIRASGIGKKAAQILLITKKKFAPASVGSNAAVARGFCSPLILRAAAAIQSGVTNGQA